METQEAIDIYKRLTGDSAEITPASLASCDTGTIEAVSILEDTGLLVERQGGTLRSRQILSLIFVMADRLDSLNREIQDLRKKAGV